MIIAIYAIHGKKWHKNGGEALRVYFLDDDEVNKLDCDAEGDINARRFSESNCFAALVSVPPPSPAGPVCFFA
jgi:hypothetical protein